MITINSHAEVVASLRECAANAFPAEKWYESAPAADVEKARRQLAFAAAVARHESGYGTLWSSQSAFGWLKTQGYLAPEVTFVEWETAVDNCGNFGAIQYRGVDYSKLTKPWPVTIEDGGRTAAVLYRDANPTANGMAPYAVYLTAYSDLRASCDGIVKEVFVNRPSVKAAAMRGDVLSFSTEMRTTRYYIGMSRDIPTAIDQHRRAMLSHLTDICRAMGWNMPNGTLPMPPMVRLFETSKWVQLAEERLKVHGFFDGTPDVRYTDETLAAVKAFQTARGLSVDGLVGAGETWPALLAAPPIGDTMPAPPDNESTTDMSRAGVVSSLQRARTLIDSALATLEGA